MEDHPMVYVSWFGAAAYCDWLSMQAGLARAYDHSTWQCNHGDPYGATGYRLPTDAEWEYAAQYDDERIYPWGNEAPDPDCSRANLWGCLHSTGSVGRYPAAPAVLDLYDMIGNVFEWCNDWHQCDLGPTAVTDPVGPAAGEDRVLRGGSWMRGDIDYRRCAVRYRNNVGPFYSITDVGLRCARSQ